MNTILAALLSSAACAAFEPDPPRGANEPPSIPDLDVSVPPGLPLEWVESLPQRYVRPEPAVPTRALDDADHPSERYAQLHREMPVRNPQGFGLVRILTWDLTAHLSWTQPTGTPHRRRSTTGVEFGGFPYPPAVDDTLHWMAVAALLRQMLHPSQVARGEVLAYLLELGDAAGGSIASAESEGALRDDARWLRRAIGAMPSEPPVLGAGATPYATMMERFCAEELLSGHPYDPDQRFAARMFLLGTTGTAFAGVHAHSEHPLLRRNAIAVVSRLGTPGTIDILRQVLERSDDSVARIRAIRAIGLHDSDKAAQILEETLASLEGKDRTRLLVEGSALVHSLGVLGRPSSVDPVVAWAEGDLKDGDRLLVALAALARMEATPEQRETLLPWLRKRLDTFKRASRWEPEVKGIRADVPDPEDLRGRHLAQAATAVLARLGGAESEEAGALLALPDQPASLMAMGRRPNKALGGIFPSLAGVVLEVYASLGAPGVARLEAILADETVEIEVRRRALELLPGVKKFQRALELCEVIPEGDGASLPLLAFQILESAEHPAVVPRAEAWIEELDEPDLAQLDPGEAYGLLLAFTTLGERGKLEPETLLRWLERVDLRPVADPEFRDTMLKLVREIFEHSDKRPEAWTDRKIEELFSTLLGAEVRSPVTPATLPDARARLYEYLGGGRRGGGRNRWIPRNTVTVEAVVDWLIGDAPEPRMMIAEASGQIRSRPDVPLQEALVLELGRLRDPAAQAKLKELAALERLPLRGPACLALAATGTAEAGAVLVDALEASRPFVRLCAYLGLRELTGEDHFADWLYGDPGKRAVAVAEYRARAGSR